MESSGLIILLFGWSEMIGSKFVLAWLANPLTIFCFFRMKKSPALCVCLGVLAFLLALDFYRAVGLSFGFDSARDMRFGQIVGLREGSYIWLFSVLLTLLASGMHLVAARFSSKQHAGPPQGVMLGTMKLTDRRIGIALVGVLVASGVATYILDHRSLENENSRLKTIVEAEFSKMKIPSGSTLIYQEVGSDRICKTAEITKLFATEASTADACGAVLALLKLEGYESRSGCRARTYPFERAPADGDRPSYNFSMLSARNASTRFGVNVSARPQNAWGPLFMLSAHGEQEAIPLARKAGKTFFTVNVFFFEDRELFQKHCPKDFPCGCSNTLFAWQFPSGRQFSRSW